MTEVGIRELKRNLSEYISRTQRGERIVVTRRGQPAAVLIPAVPRNKTEEAIWRMVEEGLASWSGKKFVPPKRRIKLRGEGPTIAEMIIEDRR
jgi:prevent-host-death family protein